MINGLTIGAHDRNPERLQIDSDLLDTFSPDVQVGDELGDITGVVGYAYGNYEVLTLSQPRIYNTHLIHRDITELIGDRDHLTVATMNVENLDPGDGHRFDELAEIVVAHLRSPDIVGLQEIQDNSGRLDDGTVSASYTYSKLINAIRTAGGPTYAFREIVPDNNRDGGQPGGNIRVGFLFNPARVQAIEQGIPGGRVDPGETPQEGAVRELAPPTEATRRQHSGERSPPRSPSMSGATAMDWMRFYIGASTCAERETRRLPFGRGFDRGKGGG